MENRLAHLKEFQQLLKDYQISDKNKEVLKQARLVLLVGPTSSGRNTIVNRLAATDKFYHIVSDTTRRMRENNGIPEKNGREYWFRSETEVLDGLRKGNYVEAAIIHDQQVSGCNIKEIIKANQTNKVAIKDIEPNGAQTIHDIKPDAIIIFVLPPSLDELLKRLHKRGELPETEIRRRLKSAYNELTMAVSKNYYQFVVNKTIEDAEQQIEAIVDSTHQLPDLNESGRQLAINLGKDLEKQLDK